MASPAELFKKFKPYPFGAHLFSRAVTFKAPYFASISPLFRELVPGRSVVFMRNRRSVHNHLATVNAIAMCALCELAAGTMVDSTLPKSLRWIPRGMTVRYLKKADTDLTGTAEMDPQLAADFNGDVVVPVKVRNLQDEIVMEADITMYLSPKKARSAAAA